VRRNPYYRIFGICIARDKRFFNEDILTSDLDIEWGLIDLFKNQIAFIKIGLALVIGGTIDILATVSPKVVSVRPLEFTAAPKEGLLSCRKKTWNWPSTENLSNVLGKRSNSISALA
jgi:hypothetical protein